MVRPSSLPLAGALGALALGMAAAGLGYGVFGAADDTGLIDPPIWPPRWFFWAIWVVLYPTIGVAGVLLWRRRDTPQGRLAWTLFVASFVATLAWVPLVQASGSRVVMPVAMDVVGFATGLMAVQTAWRASPGAARWLLPSLAWGAITLGLKVWRLVLNGA